jgi:hypothetical protein
MPAVKFVGHEQSAQQLATHAAGLSRRNATPILYQDWLWSIEHPRDSAAKQPNVCVELNMQGMVGCGS